MKMHGDTRVDEYSWLQDRKKSKVTEYLNAENTYADTLMRPTRRLQKGLYKEMRSRIVQDDMSVPVKDGPYYYYVRTRKNEERAIHCRKRGLNGKEEVILDENKLAKGKPFFLLGSAEVNPEHTMLAYSYDVTGNEHYSLVIKDLRTGKLLGEQIASVGDVAWAEDQTHLLYTKEAHPYPPRQLFLHKLGDNPKDDTLVYEDKDIQ